MKTSGNKADRRKAPVVPWVPEVFLACGGNFRCWPKAEATKDLTETGNRARKVSGTQGTPVAKFALIVGVSETGLAAIEFKWRLKIRRAKHKSIYD